MSEKKTYTIELNEKQLDLFNEWLAIRQREILEELETIKSQRERFSGTGKGSIPENPKWAMKCLKILKEHKRKMDSTEIVNILLNGDPLSATLSRAEVMRGVSSRLNQLVRRGQAKKEESEGKMLYSYVKDKAAKSGSK